MRKMATDNCSWDGSFLSREGLTIYPLRRHQKIILGMREAELSARAESCEMRLCGFGDRRVLKGPDSRLSLSQRRGCPRRGECAVGRADELLVSSALKCTFDRPAACKYWLPPFCLPPNSVVPWRSDPFPSLAVSLFFSTFLFSPGTLDEATTTTTTKPWRDQKGKFAV